MAQEKTKKLVELMNKTFYYNNLENVNSRIHLKRYLDISNRGYLIWFFTAFFGGQMYTLIEIFTQHSIPMPTWHPYNTEISPNYQLTCVLQLFSQAVMVLVMNGTDTFWSFMAFITSGQFKVLADNFENVFYKTLINMGWRLDDISKIKESLLNGNDVMKESYYEMFESIRFNEELNKELVVLIKKKIELLKFCEEMENYWSFILLPMVLLTQSYLTFSGFIMLLNTNFISTIRILQYIIPMLIEVGFMTYFGELLSNESEALQMAIYKIPWYLCSKTTQILIKMCHLRARKPARISMAKFTNVNLKTFTYLMKSSISYLTVLNKIKAR
ncbi:odorant receptor 83a-like [Onthophagus taurus]|uniref:odorant receptor 83a-like n=1 Tax=Onthophagus taurus TaxID=166361 RepID=UPI0039BE493C